jgi:Glu-tRNA(Gln) amidotransferase subunit E-like FAD-binding protein
MFLKLTKKYSKLNSNLVATTMLVTPKEVKRKLQLQEFELHEDILGKILSALDEGTIVKESISAIMEELAKNKQKDADSIISKYKLMSDAELKKEIAKLQKEFKGPPDKLIGVAIGKFRGKASPQKIIELLKK